MKKSQQKAHTSQDSLDTTVFTGTLNHLTLQYDIVVY